MPSSVQARPLASLPAAARAAAAALRAGLTATFGQDLHALYLYGAVTFPETEGTGDLDFHAILARPPSPDQGAALAALEAQMARLHAQHGADLDGWVILLDDARGSRPPAHLLRPELRDHSWALHRAHWLAGQCVILHGPGPAEIVPEPSRGDLRTALNLELSFAARDHSDAFAVLNACRIIRSVAEDDVVQSKFGSAWWGLDHLPAEHHAAIRAALARYRGAATAQENAALARGRAAIMTLAARELGR
jgi:hypothetical protein